MKYMKYKRYKRCKHSFSINEFKKIEKHDKPCAASPCRIDADGRVSGGKDLASSAYYPAAFVAQIYSVWVVEYARLRAAAHLWILISSGSQPRLPTV